MDKPAGILSVPGRGDAPHVVELLVRDRVIASDGDVRIVHRLDRGASGVMVLARTVDAQRFLTAQWAGRLVEKTYLALVHGRVVADGIVEAPLLVDRDKQKVTVDARRGKPSVTCYRVVEPLRDHTILECQPQTGRLHQIRVHLAHIGHPLAVDPRYGSSDALFLSRYKPGYRPSGRHKERPLIARLTLHALRVAFDHPDGSGRVSVEAPIPKDLRATISQLQRLRY